MFPLLEILSELVAFFRETLLGPLLMFGYTVAACLLASLIFGAAKVFGK